jgi:hypothetical protein
VVTIELARRLLNGGAPTQAIEAALVAHARDGAAFVSALLEGAPELSGLVERELSRVPDGTPELHLIRPSLELADRLPRDLCDRLLAVPIRRDAESGAIDVAAVDVLDPHVAQEFGFHLEAPVRLWRGELSAIRAALIALEGRAALEDDESPEPPPSHAPRPTFPSRIPTLRPQRSLSSNPPIPLTRRPVPHQVFHLTRSRAPGASGGFAFNLPLEEVTASFSRCDSADSVALALIEALEPADALVLAVHRDMFEARAAGGSLGPQQTPLGIASGRGSVLDEALKSGFYLGPVPPSVVHAELRARLGETVSEVYIVPIQVTGRPVLMMLTGRYGPSLDATRRADRLAAAAEQALERIVRIKRKQSETPRE